MPGLSAFHARLAQRSTRDLACLSWARREAVKPRLSALSRATSTSTRSWASAPAARGPGP